jgi:hypothetical protein
MRCSGGGSGGSGSAMRGGGGSSSQRLSSSARPFGATARCLPPSGGASSLPPAGLAQATLPRVLAALYTAGFRREATLAISCSLAIHDAIARVSPADLTCHLTESLYGAASVSLPRGAGRGGRGGKPLALGGSGGGGGGGGLLANGSSSRGSASSASSASALALRRGGAPRPSGGGCTALAVFPIARAAFEGTRLHVACARGRALRVHHLLSLGAATEARDTNHATPLLSTLRALRDGLVPPDDALDCLAALLAAGAAPGATYSAGFNEGESGYHTVFATPAAARTALGEGAGAAALRLLLAADRGGAGVRAVARRGGFTPLHAALRGGPDEGGVEPERGAALLGVVEALCARGADPNAVIQETIGTGGRIILRRPLDVLVTRLLDAPVAVAGWPYTGVRQWRDVASALLSAGANSKACLEETQVWLRKAGV